MGERTSYTPGTFCWVDLATTDAQGAKAFYAGLFGWEAEDVPAGEAGTYTMLRLRGKDVAGLYRMSEEQRTRGMTPSWVSYVSVDDVGAGAERAKSLGGTLLAEPFDVMDVGRMAVVQDPTGAVFAMWEPGRHIGASLVNDPGCLCWNQLTTTDVRKATDFYTALFGWQAEPLEGSEQPYTTWRNDGSMNGGMMAAPPGAPGPPHWLPYFTAENLDRATFRAEEVGARVVVAPMEVPAGRLAVLQDPQGAALGVFEGDTDE